MERSNLYLKLFKLVFGSVSLLANENEQMLKVWWLTQTVMVTVGRFVIFDLTLRLHIHVYVYVNEFCFSHTYTPSSTALWNWPWQLRSHTITFSCYEHSSDLLVEAAMIYYTRSSCRFYQTSFKVTIAQMPNALELLAVFHLAIHYWWIFMFTTGLNGLQSGLHKQHMKDLFVELCLTVPVRLSSLLPYLPMLMDPLVSALNGSQTLVSQVSE